jgi:DNA polymerase-1
MSLATMRSAGAESPTAQAIPSVETRDLRAFDTETWLIQPGILAPRLVCASVARPRQNTERLLDAKRARTWFRKALLNPQIHLIGANIAYDLGVMCADDQTLVPHVFEALEQGRLHDVSIRESLLDIGRGLLGYDPKTGRKLEDDEGAKYSLALLVERYLGKDISADKSGPDAWRLRYAELDGIPTHAWPHSAKAYPKSDARHTIDVFLAQERASLQVVNHGNLHDEARSVYNAWVLHLISIWGLRTDAGKVAALRAEVEAKHELAQIEFMKHGIVKPNGKESKKRVQELITAAFHGNPPVTGKGQVSTNRDTKLQSGDPILIAHAGTGKNNKYRTTYLPKLEGGTVVPINPKFYGMAATTRVTSDYQQLPQKGGIRECHFARPGHVYCSVDYGGLELRTMSQRALWHPDVGYSKMAESLLAKLDVHTVAACSFIGANYEDLLARVKAKEPIADGFRALAKVFNFGKGGGMGPKSLVYNARAKEDIRFCQLAKRLPEGKCGSEGMEEVIVRGEEKTVCCVCVMVAKELNNGWLEAWPEQADLFGIASRMTRKVSVEAVIPIVNIVRGDCGYTQWLNTPFQGMGAVLTTLAMRRISKEMYTDRKSSLWGSRLVLNVHDELIAELRADDGHQRTHDAAERMALLMREAAAECLPDLAKAIEAEPALSRILSKGVQTVRDSNGVLQVWEPEAKKAA